MVEETKAKATKKEPVGRYVAVVGLDLPAGRFEPGDEVPKKDISKHKWLVKAGKVRLED